MKNNTKNGLKEKEQFDMCLKYDFEVTFQMNNQFSLDDAMVELRDNIEDNLILSSWEEINEYQDVDCDCNKEEEEK
jgi:hypothetical protein